MPRLRCPYCGAEFEAPSGFRYVVCPYCGTIVDTGTGGRSESWVYPVRLEEQDAYTLALSRAAQLPGAPPGIVDEAAPGGGELHYLPLYICAARARAVGCEGAEEELEAAGAAAEAEWLPRGYRFPAAGRVAYDPSTARRGVFHQVARGGEELCSRLRSRAESEALGEALFSGCTPERVESDARLLGVAHYPFWLIRYSWGGGEYLAAVDAVDGNVAYLEYPIPLARRGLLLAAAAVAAVSGLAAAAAVAAAAKAAAAAAAGGVGGLGAALPFLRTAVARRGRYLMPQPRVERSVFREERLGEKTPAPASSQGAG